MDRSNRVLVDETGRLAALHRYHILDTPAEEAFDAIVRLASRVCETPIALITLIDEARQWFKARVGFELTETAREIAFCKHAITGGGMCYVHDALDDDRFRANPLVTGDPQIRFYAGVPLVTPDGYSLGTLCVIDRVPRELTPIQMDTLDLLSRETMTQLELRRVARELSKAQRALEDANVELDAFSAAAAHDLRAPLRTVHGYADLLLDEFAPQLPPQARDHLLRMRSACNSMSEVIAALLRLSRVSNAELQVTRVDLSEVASEAAHALALREAGRRVELIVAPAVHVSADRGLMLVLLENLLGNAWKFTRTRSAPRVEFGVRDRAGIREFFVRDNGIGFESSTAGTPVQPFRRRHNNPTFEGLGLGLTIADRVVRRHGGTLRIEDAAEGACVVFTLGQPQG